MLVRYFILYNVALPELGLVLPPAKDLAVIRNILPTVRQRCSAQSDELLGQSSQHIYTLAGQTLRVFGFVYLITNKHKLRIVACVLFPPKSFLPAHIITV